MFSSGRVWKFGNGVDMEHIVPTEFSIKSEADPEKLKSICMWGLVPDFHKKVNLGDIVVAGKNFGRGSAHFQPPLALKYLGLSVVAESISRNFLRNAVYVGLPVLTCPGITSKVTEGELIDVDFKRGNIVRKVSGEVIETVPLGSVLVDIIEAGGEIPYIKRGLLKMTDKTEQ